MAASAALPVAPAAANAAPPPAPDRPVLAPDVELVGQYRDSGFREPPYLIRRAGGAYLQVPRLLYTVAARCDGRRDLAAIARATSVDLGRIVRPSDVDALADKLRAAGILASPDGPLPPPAAPDPLLALRFRAAVVPPRVTRAAASALRPLFHPVVVVAALAALGVLDAWLFFDHGIAQSVRAIALHPVLLLAVLGLVVVATGFHELGHATACRYGGAEPGAMGVGLYLVWPAFYTDVTDAYRLGRTGRLRTDLGGVYFNVLFALAAAAAYLSTGAEFLLAVAAIQHVAILQQLLPWGRLDGYYVLTDLTGVPDMLSRIKPVLLGLVPWRPADRRAAELKPWVRAAASAYVLSLIPVVAAVYAMVAMSAPRVIATAWHGVGLYVGRASDAFGHGSVAVGTLAAIQAAMLVAPTLGIGLMTVRLGRTLASVGRRAWTARPRLAAAAVALCAAAALVAWAPAIDRRAIGPHTRGTIPGAFQRLTVRTELAASGGPRGAGERRAVRRPVASGQGHRDVEPAPRLRRREVVRGRGAAPATTVPTHPAAAGRRERPRRHTPARGRPDGTIVDQPVHPSSRRRDRVPAPATRPTPAPTPTTTTTTTTTAPTPAPTPTSATTPPAAPAPTTPSAPTPAAPPAQPGASTVAAPAAPPAPATGTSQTTPTPASPAPPPPDPATTTTTTSDPAATTTTTADPPPVTTTTATTTTDATAPAPTTTPVGP